MYSHNLACTAFEGGRCLASGDLMTVSLAAKAAIDLAEHTQSIQSVLVFNDATSEVVEFDWRGSMDAFSARLTAQIKSQEEAQEPMPPEHDAPEAPRGPGRPRLGVVAREVTLLPRHWYWLASQTGGASVALRKLVDAARRASEASDRIRQATNVGYKFMSTLAGHEAGFEEASRALFAGDQAGFEALISSWPVDVQAHLKKILVDAFAA